MKTIINSNGQVGIEMNISAEKGTKRYSEEIFTKMKSAMEEMVKDFYKEPHKTLEVGRTKGWVYPFAVFEVDHLSPRYYTKRKLKSFKTREEAEKMKEKTL